jgi:hypothetical protein
MPPRALVALLALPLASASTWGKPLRFRAECVNAHALRPPLRPQLQP